MGGERFLLLSLLLSPRESLEDITSLGCSGTAEGGRSLPSGLSVARSCLLVSARDDIRELTDFQH